MGKFSQFGHRTSRWSKSRALTRKRKRCLPDCVTCAATLSVPLCRCGHNEYDHEYGPCEECRCGEYTGRRTVHE